MSQNRVKTPNYVNSLSPSVAMRTQLILILCALLSLLSGCGTSAILDRNARAPEEDESIVVFKVSPANYKVAFFPGMVENGMFRQDQIFGHSRITGAPKDGYIVAKAKAGQTLALTSITELKEGSTYAGNHFEACGGTRALVFEVPRSRVAYLTDIEFERSGDRVAIRYRRDLEGAIAHVRASYPGIGRDIQPLEFQILPTAGGCGGGTVIIPIYVGR